MFAQLVLLEETTPIEELGLDVDADLLDQFLALTSPNSLAISFQNIVEELINNIINTLPSMTQYEYSDKRIGVDDYVLFLNNMDAFIENLRGKLILVEFV